MKVAFTCEAGSIKMEVEPVVSSYLDGLAMGNDMSQPGARV